jgi:hypothetical protein
MCRYDTYSPRVWFVVSLRSWRSLARIVASGLPHHLSQRRNRREPIFFEDADPGSSEGRVCGGKTAFRRTYLKAP